MRVSRKMPPERVLFLLMHLKLCLGGPWVLGVSGNRLAFDPCLEATCKVFQLLWV